MKSHYDVIIFGGGTAGVVAAIQAGRSGARTLLVEKTGIMGGTITTCRINAPSYFFAWGKQIIKGIGWELIRKTLAEEGRKVPTAEISANRARPAQITINTALFAALSEEMALDAGVELLYHTMPAEIAKTVNGWEVAVCTKTGLQTASTKVLVDATGDANVTVMAGYQLNHYDYVQPASLSMALSGYNKDDIDFDALSVAAKAAIDGGELLKTDVSWTDNNFRQILDSYGSNCNHISANYAADSEGKTMAEIEGRKSLLRMYRFYKKQPGLERLTIDRLCVETGIRETVTIKGKATVTVADYESGKHYDDALCYAFFPIDEHLHDGKGVNYRELARNIIPMIPRGALLPEGSSFLIAAGRMVSSDRVANSALRVQAPCFAMGQAAGVMAALSAATGIDPADLPLPDIYAELRKHDAIVPADLQSEVLL